MNVRSTPLSAMVAGLVLVNVAACCTAAAQQGDGWGRIAFPTSGRAEAQPHFLRGVAALHSFEYEQAREAFQQAQAIDPGFAMAYWGEAMAYNRTLWLHEDLNAARAALARLAPTAAARAAKAPTTRERAYLAAVEILTGSGDKQARDVAYERAMRRLAADYPEDREAAAYHALALLATTQRGLTALASDGDHQHALAGSAEQREAADILQRVLALDPDHPGANHYLIHTWDDPQHAERALPIARRYATLAPAAAHALHMPAHIFVQLGLWSEASASDEASFAASDAWVRRKGLPLAMRSYHSLSWLHYAYLQQGRFREAADALATIDAVAREAGEPFLRGTAATMRARQAVESGEWSSIRGRTRFDNTDELYAIGISAARLGDRTTAAMVRDELGRRTAAPETGERRPLAAMMELQMGGLVALAANDAEAAIRLLEAAAGAERLLPGPLGPPAMVKPSAELLGEVLLELGRPQDARARFEEALATYRNRSASVLGLARAGRAAGDPAAARDSYRVFLANWEKADAGRAELDEARQLIGGGVVTGTLPFAAAVVALGAVGTLVVWRRRRRSGPRPASRVPVARRTSRRRR